MENFHSLAWEEIRSRLGCEVRDVLERVLESPTGRSLSREGLRILAYARGDDLLGVIAAADRLRKELVGDVITYVVNRNINFTNICIVGCKFCAYSCSAQSPGAFLLSPEEVADRAAEARKQDASEVCIQGGLPPELPAFYYRDILRSVKRAAPEVHTHAFSPMEISYGVARTGMPLRDYLCMLKSEGLDTMPGTAAEILDDEIRSVICRNKLGTEHWRQVVTTAHQCGIPTTATLMYGHRETPGHWADNLLLLRAIQAETGGFTEFVPLGFIHHNTALFRQGLSRPGPTIEEHLKIHALARIALAGSINNVQVSWVKMSREAAQLCLRAGANDYGGTLMEENISRLAGGDAGQRMSPAEFQQRIRALGRIPAQRNTTYSEVRLR